MTTSKKGSRSIDVHSVVEAGDLKQLKQHLETFPNHLHRIDRVGKTLLHVAVKYLYYDIVKYLITEKRVDVNAMDGEQWTPLHLASNQGNLKICYRLLQNKAYPFVRTSEQGFLPIHFLANYSSGFQNQELRLVRVLSIMFQDSEIPESSIDVETSEGETALHIACTRGDSFIAKFLIENGANMIKKNKKGYTPLDLARISNREDLIDYLQKKYDEEYHLPVPPLRAASLRMGADGEIQGGHELRSTIATGTSRKQQTKAIYKRDRSKQSIAALFHNIQDSEGKINIDLKDNFLKEEKKEQLEKPQFPPPPLPSSKQVIPTPQYLQYGLKLRPKPNSQNQSGKASNGSSEDSELNAEQLQGRRKGARMVQLQHPYFVQAKYDSSEVVDGQASSMWLKFSKNDILYITGEELHPNGTKRLYGNVNETGKSSNSSKTVTGWISQNSVVPLSSYCVPNLPKKLTNKTATRIDNKTNQESEKKQLVKKDKSSSMLQRSMELLSAIKESSNDPRLDTVQSLLEKVFYNAQREEKWQDEREKKAVVKLQAIVRGWFVRRVFNEWRRINLLPKRLLDELVETEQRYINDLAILLQKFVNPLRKADIVSHEELNKLVPNIDEIYHTNQELLSRLLLYLQVGRRYQPEADSAPKTNSLGKIFLDLADYLKVYINYFNKYDPTLPSRLQIQNPGLATFISKFNELPEVKPSNLENFLAKPFQRPLKYPLILERLLAESPEDHIERPSLYEAHKRISALSREMNEQKRRAENQQRVLRLQNSLFSSFSRHKINLVAASREFKAESNTMVMITPKHGGTSTLQLKFYLFNDIAVYAIRKDLVVRGFSTLRSRLSKFLSDKECESEIEEFQFANFFHLDKNVRLFHVPHFSAILQTESVGSVFQLVFHRAQRPVSFTLVAASVADKLSWMQQIHTQLEYNKKKGFNVSRTIDDSTQKITKDGWLNVAIGKSGWKRRFLCLQGQTLFIYKDAFLDEELINYALGKGTVVEQIRDEEFVFEIRSTPSEDTSRLRADNKDEYRNWFAAISNAKNPLNPR